MVKNGRELLNSGGHARNVLQHSQHHQACEPAHPSHASLIGRMQAVAGLRRQFVSYSSRVGPRQPANPSEYDSPPTELVGKGQLDSVGFSVLYGSQDLDICIHECRATAEDACAHQGKAARSGQRAHGYVGEITRARHELLPGPSGQVRCRLKLHGAGAKLQT